MRKEQKKIHNHLVWKIVPQPTQMKVVPSRSVLNLKKDPTSSTYKAPFVAEGCLQRDGVNVADTFVPTLSKDCFCLVVSVSASLVFRLRQLVAQLAFLHRNIDSPAYVMLPEMLL
jgi:Reverse transcriptase (RNA-dependent DNA polymerase)